MNVLNGLRIIIDWRDRSTISLTSARSELGEQLKGSVLPSCEQNGSTSPEMFILPPNKSESAFLGPVEQKGSLDAGAGLVVLEANGSWTAAGGEAVSFSLAANRSGSGMPGVVPNGSTGAENGSSEEKAELEVCAKKESAANGSEPLNGSPPKGSENKYRQKMHIKHLTMKIFRLFIK